MEGERLESIFVMTSKSVYVDKTHKNETVDLWLARFGHVGYPQLEIREDIVYVGCQYGKAH